MQIFNARPVSNALWERLRQADDDHSWPGELTLKALLARWFFARNEDMVLRLHPQMTLHDLHHAEAVAWNAAELARTSTLLSPQNAQMLGTEEVYYLLAACYLHDIGMGVQHGEQDRAEAARVGISKNEVIRRHHHERSDDFVRQHAGELYLDGGQAAILGLLCKAHCSSEVLGKPPYVNRAGLFGKPVRIALLAAILRIADELDLDHTRAPNSVRKLLDNTGWFDSISRLHWLKHYYTLSTTIEATHGTEIAVTPRIVIRVPQSPNSEYYFQRIKSLLFRHLDKEISSVRNVVTSGFYFGEPAFEMSVQENLTQRLLTRDHVRLLIVDDNTDYLGQVVGALKARFGHVTAVSSPLDAFVLVTRNPERFHVGIIDLEMPDLPGEAGDSGMDAGTALISAFSGVAADMALVANTGHANGGWQAKAIEAGAHVVRTKFLRGADPDVEAGDLGATVEKALDLLGYDIERENDDDQGKKVSDSGS